MPTIKTIYRDLDPVKLRPHPKSQAIYQDAPSDELQKSIAANGVLDPLILAADEKTVISGRRRRMAAIACKRKTVPCIIRRDLTSELDIREALLESNIRNERTTEQRAREYAERLAIEAERAALRRVSGVGADDSTGRSKAKAAEASGIGFRTAEMALDILEKAAEATEAGKPELAEQIVDTLNNESVAAAARLVGEVDELIESTEAPTAPEKSAPKAGRSTSASPKKVVSKDEVAALGKAKDALAALIRHMPKEVYKECKPYLKIIEQKLNLFSAVKR